MTKTGLGENKILPMKSWKPELTDVTTYQEMSYSTIP